MACIAVEMISSLGCSTICELRLAARFRENRGPELPKETSSKGSRIDLQSDCVSFLMDYLGSELPAKIHADRVAGASYPGDVRAVGTGGKLSMPTHQQPAGPLP